MKKTVAYFILSFVALFSLMSCQRGTIFEKNIHIPSNGWDQKEIARFDVPVEDTLSFYELYLFLRNDETYPYQNVFFFLDVVNPQGEIQRDTIEILLADIRGKWLGNGFGAVKENEILLNQAVRFPRSGTYSFQFEQAMRDEVLPGLKDIGLKVEKRK